MNRSQTHSTVVDHGVPVPANEGRTAAICKNESGDCRLVIAARGYVVIVNPNDRSCRQVAFPEQYVDYPFASYSSENGMFYTGAGYMFMVLDPFAGAFVDYAKPGLPGEIIGFSFTEDRDGKIYCASYPLCRLMKYDPGTKTLKVIGKLDPEEKYPFNLAIDQYGWLYAGIGTERITIAAFDLQLSQAQSLFPESGRVKGRGKVHLGEDGHVYGVLDVESEISAQQWFLLEQGKKIPVHADEVSRSSYSGAGFGAVHRSFPYPWILLEQSLSEKQVILQDESSGQTFTISLSYETDGADLSPLAAGPDGYVYGTSNHPLHFYRYDPHTNLVENYGGKMIENGGGGNICAYAVQGSLLVGAAYAGGHVHRIDTSRPFQIEWTEERNPKQISSCEEIHRPRCALAHPDGVHVIFGGYGGYGTVGGGLYILNVESGEDWLLTNDQLVRYHSTMCLVPLANGDILCGTSVEAPGGGKPKEAEARLYRLDWRTRQVIYSEVPIPGTTEIALMEIDHNGLVHAFTAEMYFVYDPQTRAVIHTREIGALGRIVRNGLVKDDASRIYGVRSRSIFRIDTDSFELIQLSTLATNITAGLALLDGRLYFASGKRLHSFDITAGK
ncbi:MAG: hypothetical protein K0R67_937 [Paenibacillus sp.]|nr:hypothetical protein [Paenibacillus sp.]